jgi:CheY-like chemotaxis protein
MPMTTTITQPIHVLVVDDEPDVEPMFRQKFRKDIKAKKIDFHFVFSAAEALEYLNCPNVQSELTLILSDINMPGMSGLELLRTIKEKSPKLAVFMVTAYGDRETEQKAIDYGADGFIKKPVDFAVLKQEIFNFASNLGSN